MARCFVTIWRYWLVLRAQCCPHKHTHTHKHPRSVNMRACVRMFLCRAHTSHTHARTHPHGFQWISVAKKKAMSSQIFPPSRQETIEAEGCVFLLFCLQDIHIHTQHIYTHTATTYTQTYIYTYTLERRKNVGNIFYYYKRLTYNVYMCHTKTTKKKKNRRQIQTHTHTYTQSDRKLFSFIHFLLCFHYFLFNLKFVERVSKYNNIAKYCFCFNESEKKGLKNKCRVHQIYFISNETDTYHTNIHALTHWKTNEELHVLRGLIRWKLYFTSDTVRQKIFCLFYDFGKIINEEAAAASNNNIISQRKLWREKSNRTKSWASQSQATTTTKTERTRKIHTPICLFDRKFCVRVH